MNDQQLKQKYLDAETNMQTAPIKLEQSKKNYYIYTEGRPYYDSIKEEDLNKKANTISAGVSAIFRRGFTSAACRWGVR